MECGLCEMRFTQVGATVRPNQPQMHVAGCTKISERRMLVFPYNLVRIISWEGSLLTMHLPLSNRACTDGAFILVGENFASCVFSRSSH